MTGSESLWKDEKLLHGLSVEQSPQRSLCDSAANVEGDHEV